MGDGQVEAYMPISVDGTDLGILPIVSVSGRVTGAAICCANVWWLDKTNCFIVLEDFRSKGLSLEYWFLAKNYKKVAFWGVDELSLVFANEIKHYPGIELLGIYDIKDHRNPKIVDHINYAIEVNYVESIDDVVETGAELVIVSDWAMRFLEDYPLTTNVKMKVAYVRNILKLNNSDALYGEYMRNTDPIEYDVTRHVYTELFNRYKAKFGALGCNFLTVSIPNNEDLNISKDFSMSDENVSRRVAEWNGWEQEGEEIKEFMKELSLGDIIKIGELMYSSDIKSTYRNFINKSRVVLNAPTTYKNIVYLIGTCIVQSPYCTDDQTLGYYLQENVNKLGLEYRIVPIQVPNYADRYYHSFPMQIHTQQSTQLHFQATRSLKNIRNISKAMRYIKCQKSAA